MKTDAIQPKGIFIRFCRSRTVITAVGVLCALAFSALITPCRGQVLTNDNFEDGDALGWTVISGDWAVEGGEYRQRAALNASSMISLAGSPATERYKIQTDFLFHSVDFAPTESGIVFRYQNELNYEIIDVYVATDSWGWTCNGAPLVYLSHITVKEGVWNWVQTGVYGDLFLPRDLPRYGLNDFGPWRISAEVDGTAINVSVNGQFVFTAVDQTGFTGGAVGLFAYLEGAAFDNWQVSEIQAPEPGPQVEWTRQTGSSPAASALDAAGNLYVTESLGTYALVRKFNSVGMEVWTRQFSPTTGNVNVHGLCVDSTGIYAVGEVSAPFPGQTQLGEWDGYLIKLDSQGNILWNTQFGTIYSDYAQAVSAFGGAIYVAGGSEIRYFSGYSIRKIGFVRKFDPQGAEIWVRTFGAANLEDFSWGQTAVGGLVATENGIFIGGSSKDPLSDEPDQGDFFGTRMYIRRYSSNGDYIWTRYSGSHSPLTWTGYACEEVLHALSADATGVYATGYIHGAFPGQISFDSDLRTAQSLPPSIGDAFVAKYDLAGNQLWVRQFGSDEFDEGVAVAANSSGIYVAGRIGNRLLAQSSAGIIPGGIDPDAFLRCYSPDGAQLWHKQIGGTIPEFGVAVSAGVGNVYLVGRTSGNTDQGFIVKFKLADNDSDGISTASENAAPNNGDGNTDGILDSQQQNVASLPNSADGQFVTVVCPAAQTLEGVQSIPNPSPSDTPPGSAFPVGFLTFAVNGMQLGAATTVTLILPPGTSVNAFCKYGPTLDNNANHWYVFSYDGTTGAEILPDRIILHFVDGLRGDSDLQANGKILDPGAPVFLTVTVKTPAQQLSDLSAVLQSMSMESGLKTSLNAKLQAALASINRNNTSAACGALQAFVKEVKAQTGKKVTLAQADQLANGASSIGTSLGCSR